MEKLIIGNFKMNKTIKECKEYAVKFSGFSVPPNRKVVLCPPAYALDYFYLTLKNNTLIGAQNVAREENGALTGEISASMLKSVGVCYGLVGHSERRRKLGEGDDDVNAKAKLLENVQITPIICIGESIDEMRKKKSVLGAQITKAIKGLCGDFIIAYEPVWAIGTGKACEVCDIEKTHKFIKEKVEKLTGKKVTVLYGGSVKSSNAKIILSSSLVDGVLVGGACLDPEEFNKIVTA